MNISALSTDELESIASKIHSRITQDIDPKLLTEIGSDFYFMTTTEKEVLHEMHMRAPTYGQLRFEAKQRIQEKLINRKKERLLKQRKGNLS